MKQSATGERSEPVAFSGGAGSYNSSLDSPPSKVERDRRSDEAATGKPYQHVATKLQGLMLEEVNCGADCRIHTEARADADEVQAPWPIIDALQ